MAKRTQIRLVYLAGLVQGVALVTFPAASSIFTAPHSHGYGFSNSQYGAMFLPQVVLAILASSLALLVAAFLLVSQISSAVGAIVAFGLADLACSAFFPLSVSLGGKEFPRLTAIVSGELIAFYQLGYGIAAFGVGPLSDLSGVPLSAVYAGASLVAGAMIVIAFLVIRPQAAKAARASA